MRILVALALALATSAAHAKPTDASVNEKLAAVKSYEKPTKEQMVSFVKAAADYIAVHGREAAFKEFQTKPGRFNKGQLYVYAYDFDCNVKAHGLKPMLVGKNLADLTDKTGKHPNQELRDAAKSGAGFVEFYWENPETKKIQKKIGYAMKVADDLFIGSGIYVE